MNLAPRIFKEDSAPWPLARQQIIHFSWKI